MAGCKNQITMRYQRKCLFSNICHIEFIIYIGLLQEISVHPRGGQLGFQNIFSDATRISIPNYFTSLGFSSIYFGN